MTRYLDWNDALAGHFFKPEMAEREVYLYVTEQLIEEIGRAVGGTVAEFVDSVERGPPWSTASGFCQRALQCYEGWRDRDLPFPPYVAYLALFVLAGGVPGECAPNGYYPKLRKLLGYETGSQLPSFERMLDVWDDLERWSTRDRDGELGRFTARIVGGWIHVGLPLAQTLLTQEERAALPDLFTAAQLDPDHLPTDGELGRALRQHGAECFGRRTRLLIENRHDDGLYGALLDIVASELSAWGGHATTHGQMSGDERPRLRGSLRLCLRLDEVQASARATLRCRLASGYPEDGELTLALVGHGSRIASCHEAVGGWSTPLAEANSARVFDASEFSFSSGLAFHDDAGATLRWRGSDVRVLVSGEGEGLPGLVEVNELPEGRPFYLVCQKSTLSRIEPWLRADCLEHTRLTVRTGLPNEEVLVRVEGAESDKRIRDAYPSLSLPVRAQCEFRHGLRSAPGNNFFSFGKPALALKRQAEVVLKCNDHELTRDPRTGGYELPDELAPETKHVIEAFQGERVITRRWFVITDSYAWRSVTKTVAVDRFGSARAQSGARVSGALTFDAPVPAFRPDPFSIGDVHVHRGGVLVLGRRPGEVMKHDQDSRDCTWNAAWLILRSRRLDRVLFCGLDVAECEPLAPATDAKPRLIDEWKEAIWHRRKRARVNATKSVRDLWHRFMEVAREL